MKGQPLSHPSLSIQVLRVSKYSNRHKNLITWMRLRKRAGLNVPSLL